MAPRGPRGKQKLEGQVIQHRANETLKAERKHVGPSQDAGDSGISRDAVFGRSAKGAPAPSVSFGPTVRPKTHSSDCSQGFSSCTLADTMSLPEPNLREFDLTSALRDSRAKHSIHLCSQTCPKEYSSSKICRSSSQSPLGEESLARSGSTRTTTEFFGLLSFRRLIPLQSIAEFSRVRVHGQFQSAHPKMATCSWAQFASAAYRSDWPSLKILKR